MYKLHSTDVCGFFFFFNLNKLHPNVLSSQHFGMFHPNPPELLIGVQGQTELQDTPHHPVC